MLLATVMVLEKCYINAVHLPFQRPHIKIFIPVILFFKLGFQLVATAPF